MARSLERAGWIALTALLAATPGRPAETAPAPAPKAPLRVAVVPEPDRPEFFAVDPKQNPGFEREILDGFARAEKVQLEVVTVSKWDALIPQLLEGKADILAGHFTNTDERREHVDFTQGLLPTRTVVITRKPHAPVTTVKQLLALDRIGAVKGSATQEDLLAAGVPRANIDESVTPINMLDLLKSKKVSALARSVPLAVLSQRDDPEIEIGMFVGPGSHFAFGVKKGNTALRDALNAHLDVLHQTGQWNRLVVKYFGPAAVDILKKAQVQ
jgi:ABC-type amino acid transport substrate-binding protein